IDVIPDAVSTTTYDVAGDESVQIVVPRNSRSVPNLTIGKAIRMLRRNPADVESYDWWRIAERTRASGAGASTYTYLARSPLFDLSKGDVSQVLSTGE